MIVYLDGWPVAGKQVGQGTGGPAHECAFWAVIIFCVMSERSVAGLMVPNAGEVRTGFCLRASERGMGTISGLF
ncbi:hypothetical protein AA21952_0723 [Acetobacter oeni LMG 21952]|nr:hypothetical protein AA21952_0723 [Acetobacter oeni LMG 21952]